MLCPTAKGEAAAGLASSGGDGAAHAAALQQPVDATTAPILYFSSMEHAGEQDEEGDLVDMGPASWSALFMQLSRWARRDGPVSLMVCLTMAGSPGSAFRASYDCFDNSNAAYRWPYFACLARGA